MSTTTLPPPATRWQRLSAASVRAFHVYAGWLVSISWWRFVLLSILLLIVASILQNIPPFSWRTTEVITFDEAPAPPTAPAPPAAPKEPAKPKEPVVKIEKSKAGKEHGYEISIDERGVRITPKTPPTPASVPQGAASVPPVPDAPSVEIRLPPGSTSETVREAVEEARRAITEAIDEAKSAKEEAEAAREEAEDAVREATGVRKRVRTTRLGDPLPELAFLWIMASLIIKVTYKKQIQAEAQAARRRGLAQGSGRTWR